MQDEPVLPPPCDTGMSVHACSGGDLGSTHTKTESLLTPKTAGAAKLATGQLIKLCSRDPVDQLAALVLFPRPTESFCVQLSSNQLTFPCITTTQGQRPLPHRKTSWPIIRQPSGNQAPDHSGPQTGTGLSLLRRITGAT